MKVKAREWRSFLSALGLMLMMAAILSLVGCGASPDSASSSDISLLTEVNGSSK